MYATLLVWRKCIYHCRHSIWILYPHDQAFAELTFSHWASVIVTALRHTGLFFNLVWITTFEVCWTLSFHRRNHRRSVWIDPLASEQGDVRYFWTVTQLKTLNLITVSNSLPRNYPVYPGRGILCLFNGLNVLFLWIHFFFSNTSLIFTLPIDTPGREVTLWACVFVVRRLSAARVVLGTHCPQKQPWNTKHFNTRTCISKRPIQFN